jgi:hypothetical protein
MLRISRNRFALTALPALGLAIGCALPARAQMLNDVFYIEMENHNFTQPGSQTSPNQIKGNAAAPFQNSLITPGNSNAAQTSWASQYFNVLAGTGNHIHPSEPNYIWQEAGTNFGVLNDNTPYGTDGTNQNTNLHLSGLLQAAGISWKSYQEDRDTDAAGNVLPKSQWTVPLNNMSGSYTTVHNAYNGSLQYNFAPKHDGQLFFTDTNGGNDTTPSNPEARYYAPLQQLSVDLNSNTVARYNLITPDQYNDSHSVLTGGFTYHGVNYTGDAAAIAQGDNFLSILVPEIMASQAYKNNGAIVIWWDETEDGDDFDHTLEEIVISPLAKGNAYESALTYTHSSDLKSMEELFGVYAPDGSFLGDASTPGTNDLSDLFVGGALVPEPSQTVTLGLGALSVIGLIHRLRTRRRAS